MDGTISVKSILGEGSEFSIILPILDDSFSLKDNRKTQISNLSGFMDRHDSNYQPNQNKEPSYSSENLETTINEKLSTILVADDNADVQTYIASVLSPDYNFLMAKNGQECEDLAFETIPDLIISDVMMPIKDGFEICKTLKSDERTSHIPIILLTAKADVESKLLGLAHGADVYLMKPFHKEELLMRIKKLLELRQQLQKHYLSALSNEPLALSNEHLNSSNSKPHSSKLIAQSLENAFVIKVKTVVEAHLTDTKFDVEVLERALNLSHSQLHRKLIALTGLSANSFIRCIKLIKAKELLLNSPYSIQAIAFDSGFNEQAYFSRVFKQEFGETPQAWRERNTV